MPELAILPMDDSVRGRELVFRYETAFYYDPVLTESPEGWRLTLERKPFPAPVTRQFTDTLLAPWLEEPRVFAARAEGRDLGYLELSHETWNNRMRISNLWVAEGRRRQGIGAAPPSWPGRRRRPAGPGPGPWCWRPRAATTPPFPSTAGRALPSPAWI